MDKEAVAQMHFSLERVAVEAALDHVYLAVNDVS